MIVLDGKVQGLSFRGQPAELPIYEWNSFDINSIRHACKVSFPDGTAVALSRWTGPKRTRTYPLASLYDAYSYSGKIITVIPIVKDEGLGERKNDSNLDRVNFITLSWMSLMNIYIILAWYNEAKKKSDSRITCQKIQNNHVKQKIQEILAYRQDAHHWNQKHFTEEFIPIYQSAIESYETIGRELKVQMHDRKIHEEYLRRVRCENQENTLNLERFKQISLARSHQSAITETRTEHALESRGNFPKPLFRIVNNLGGHYYLTADEVEFIDESEVVIRENKNTTRAILPSMPDIKDGLFKLLLYSQLSELRHGDQQLRFRAQLCLSGRFQGELQLPAESGAIERFLQQFKSRGSSLQQRLHWLNRELKLLGIEGILKPARTVGGDGGES